MLTAIGYVSEAASQAEAVSERIYTAATLIPGVCYLVVFLIMQFRYPLTRSEVEKIPLFFKKRESRRTARRKSMKFDRRAPGQGVNVSCRCESGRAYLDWEILLRKRKSREKRDFLPVSFRQAGSPCPAVYGKCRRGRTHEKRSFAASSVERYV